MGCSCCARARQLLMMASHRGFASRSSPSSTLKVTNRTLPWGWYFSSLTGVLYRRILGKVSWSTEGTEEIEKEKERNESSPGTGLKD